MSHAAIRDSVVRMALASMAADPQSALTTVQRQWIVDLVPRTTPLTAHERERLKAPLLAWVEARQPRILVIVAAQFAPCIPEKEGV